MIGGDSWYETTPLAGSVEGRVSGSVAITCPTPPNLDTACWVNTTNVRCAPGVSFEVSVDHNVIRPPPGGTTYWGLLKGRGHVLTVSFVGQ